MMPRRFLMMFIYVFIASCLSLGWLSQVAAVEKAKVATSSNSPHNVAVDCRQLLDRQDVILEEVRRLKRELALLRHTISKPGVEEIFAGLGYIIGLFGVVFFVLARKKG